MNELTWFKEPKASERMHPFWFWNGDMEDEVVVRQIQEMSVQGIGGFFLCARQGMTVPYLSAEWFRKVRVALDAAERYGMDVWLYDEYPYPSGIAGGEVTLKHPDAVHYTLEHESFQVEGGETLTAELPWSRILSAIAVPVDPKTKQRLWQEKVDLSSCIGNWQADPVFQKTGLTAYNQKRFFTYRTVKKIHWTAPEGQWEVHVFMEKPLEDFKYYGTFVDPCHEEAIRTFIEITHERYAQEIGEYFGRTVKGMFTDETGFLGRMPWTPQLVPYFIEHYGYDLREHMHELLFGGGEKTAKVRYDYFQALHLLLRERYHRPIREWCDKHGLQYVAEVPAMRMTTQLYSHVPGGDGAHEKLGRSLEWILDQYMLKLRNNPKMVSSLMRQLGAERALIECFHSVGWSMTLQDARWMIDRMAAMGVNFFNQHAFFYTLDGLTKHDAPPSQFLQNPYWQHYRLLGDYAGRISAVMSRGHANISVAVIDPTTSFWTHMGNPLHTFQFCGKDEADLKKLEQLKSDWSYLCKKLMLARRDYDHLDPEWLADAVVEDGEIRIGHARYRALILPPMSNLEAAAWTKVQAFMEQGGLVIANGLLPYESIEQDSAQEKEWLNAFGMNSGLGSSMRERYWAQAAEAESEANSPWTKGAKNAYFIPGPVTKRIDVLLELLDERMPAAVKLVVENDAEPFLMQQRVLSERQLAVFISNQEDGHHRTELAVDASLLGELFAVDGKLVQSGDLRFAKLDLETGERVPLTADKKEQGWVLPLSFAPYESHLIEIAFVIAGATDTESVTAATSAGSAEQPWRWEVEAQVPWELEAEQHNLIRFDHFDLEVEQGAKAQRVMVKTFIDQCADLDMVPPARYEQIFGTPQKMGIAYPLACRYATQFTVSEKPESCLILMDRGAISGHFVIRLNDHELTADHFKNEEVYDHMNRVCDVSDLLQVGTNTLAVHVTVEHDYDGVVDAIYLMGSFGVQHHADGQPVLITPAKQSPLHRGPYTSYPYYAGTLNFKRDVHMEELPSSSTFELVFPDWDSDFYECAEVRVNGHSLGMRAWTPYRWQGKCEWLKTGNNTVEVKVTNTLIGMLEGKYFDYRTHTLQDVATYRRDEG